MTPTALKTPRSKDLARSTKRKLGKGTVQLSHKVMSAFLDTVLQTLLTRGRVRLARIGTLHLQHRPARRMRHPTTGELYTAPARVLVKFTPAPTLRKRAAEVVQSPRIEGAP